MSGLDVGAWIAFSSVILSGVLAFNGYRNTTVNQLCARIEDLEKRIQELNDNYQDCQSDLRRERRERMWLMDQLSGTEAERQINLRRRPRRPPLPEEPGDE